MKVFGTLPGGKAVHRIDLMGSRLKATILTYGARLHAVSFEDGPNAVTGSDDLTGYLGAACYAGPVVGPVANRIAGAQAEIDGQVFQFEANQDGLHSLHSGTGIHGLVWDVVEQAAGSVHLSVSLPDGLGGFPGVRVIDAEYCLEGADLCLTLRARTDAPTLMNLAHHGVWSLEEGVSRNAYQLWIGSDRYLPTAAGKIPTGEVALVEGTVFDHRSPRAPNASLDHNFCFPTEGDQRCMARLIAPSGRFVEVHSDAPGLQVYAGGARGVALEPQLWPDAPHHAGFPSILLRPGAVFEQRSVFRLGHK